MRKYMVLLIAAFALTLAGCPTDGGDDGALLYKVSVDRVGDGAITVSPTAALAGGVAEGTVITLIPQPASGYVLAEVQINTAAGEAPLTGPNYTFTISGDVQVSARFSVLAEIPINSGEELAKIGKDPAYPLEGHYYLTGDIDLAGFDPWTPIGTSIIVDNPEEYYYTGREFTGAFDGQGKTIQNLHLKGSAVYAGLFGYTLFAAIKDVTIQLAAGDVTLSGGKQFAGAAAGFAVGTNISDVTVENNLTLSGGYHVYAGNVIGYALYSTPVELAADGDLDVSGSGNVYAGGLIGYAGSSPLGDGHTATGSVTVVDGGSGYAGGVVGYASASPIGSGTYGTGAVSVESGAAAYGGGIAGYATGSAVTGVSAGRAVTVTGVTDYVAGGGIVGRANSSPISEATASGTVTVTATGSASTYGGGIAGYPASSSPISEATASGAVTVTGTSGTVYAGGVAGSASSAIAGSHAAGAVTAEGTSTVYTGGLAGYATAGVTGSSATGGVSAESSGASSTVYAGGLAGYSSGNTPIAKSYAEGAVSATGTGATANVYAGGLGGSVNSPLNNSYAAGDVTVAAGANVRAGGLAGYTASYTVSRCYAAGAVAATTTNATANSNGAGGLVGITYSNASTKIEYCVAFAPSVSISAGSSNVGRVNGLKGASAVLSGNAALDSMTLNSGSESGSPTNNADGKDGATKTSSDLDQDYYSDTTDEGGLGWDFAEIWQWDDDNDRPILAWQ
jgi:hypothetical protein